MKKHKICVYSICKNEEKFVDRFMDCLEEIKDHVYVLDTGSTDNTIEKFKARGAHIKAKKYDKFEFHKARNDALKLVPKEYEICICLDIDDCIDPGFVEKINANWKENTTQLKYYHYCNLNSHDEPLIKFLCGKIHKRDCYRWKYPIHEVLKFIGEKEESIDVPDIIVRHRPDVKKSRAFYMDLLEEYVENNPENTRNVYLLTKEYRSKRQWEKCIAMAHKYLKIKNATYREERGQILASLAKSYCNLEYYEEAELWGLKALKEIEDCRTPYVELMVIYYKQKKYEEVIKYGLKALKIKKRNKHLTEEISCWDGTIYDYLSLSYFYLKDYDNAIKYIDLDIKENPDIERLKENKRIFLDAKNNKNY